MKHYIIEGIDGIGKSMLVNGLEQRLCGFTSIHFTKPNDNISDKENYQITVYKSFMKILQTNIRTIYDRFHLSEMVYALMYRGYDAKIVRSLECNMLSCIEDLKLILLITDDFSILKDDGKSHDFLRAKEEQIKFLENFKNSSIKNKVIINVMKKDKRKSVEELVGEILR